MLKVRLIDEANSVTADFDSGIGVFGQFWAAYAHGVFIKINTGDIRTDYFVINYQGDREYDFSFCR